MAERYGHGDGFTRYGRKLKPTSRVKALIIDNLQVVYQNTLTDLDCMCNKIQACMQQEQENEFFVPMVDEWLGAYDELTEAEADYRRYLEEEELIRHDIAFERKIEFYTYIQNEIGSFIERRSEKRRRVDKYEQLINQRQRLQRDFDTLEKELSTFSITSTQGKPGRPFTTSTPKETPVCVKQPGYMPVKVKEERIPLSLEDDERFREPLRRPPFQQEIVQPNDILYTKPKILPTLPEQPRRTVGRLTQPIPAYQPHDEAYRQYIPYKAPEIQERIRSEILPPSRHQFPPPYVPPPVEPPDRIPVTVPYLPPLPKKVSEKNEDDRTMKILEMLAGILAKKEDKLPDKEPSVFSGGLIEFPLWWNSFETLVERRTSTSSERLFYLDKYTSGEAKKSIFGFLHLYDDENAYTRAKTTLQSRFGNKRKVAEAFRDRLNKYPTIKRYDAKALQGYADLLWQCHAAMQTISYLSYLEIPEENIKMAQKLPPNLMEKWNNYLDKQMYSDLPDQTRTEEIEEMPYPPMLEFCKFVSGEARKADGPCALKSAPNEKPRRGTVLNTSTQQSEEKEKKPPECLFCKKAHPIHKCSTFLANSAEYKKTYARTNALCYGCLRRNHIYRTCRIRNPELMKEPTVTKAVNLYTSIREKGYFSPIVPIELYHVSDPEVRVLTYCSLDTQSDSCFIQEDLIDQLGINCKPVNLEITTINRKEVVPSNLVFGLRARGLSESYEMNLPKCYSKEVIPGDVQSIPTPEKLRKWSHLKTIADEFHPYDNSMKIGVLIGYNAPAALYASQQIHAGEEEPFGMKTRLGWTAMGKVDPEDTADETETEESHVCCFTSSKESHVTTDEIKHAFDLEFLESKGDMLKKMSMDDYGFMGSAETTLKQREDKHFELNLPFRDEPQNLPDNRGQAYSNLMSLKKRLTKDEVHANRYKAFIDNMIKLGHAEKVTTKGKKGKTWYWSHHGVYHPHKPGKLRVVWNGKLPFRGISINDLLLAGPDQLNNLLGVLTRFRSDAYAFTCDVEGMFHQVKVPVEQRDYLRFLWYKNGDPNEEVEEYQMTVHLFGATSSPGCSNYAFKQMAEKLEEKGEEMVTEFIKKSFYVDDGLKALPEEKKVVEMIMKSHNLCQRGGFNLHKYLCNSRNVMEQIPEKLRAADISMYEFTEPNSPLNRTLGLLWHVILDLFLFLINVDRNAETRREMLSLLSSVYDPLGMIGPVILPGRQLLQELCVSEYKWDDKIGSEFIDRWNRWYKELTNLQELKIPRCIRSTTAKIKSAHLLTFSDASTKGYGAVSYLKIIDENDVVDVNLVLAKSRVVPNKKTTIPRLELQAAVLAARLSLFLSQELEYEQIITHFWTDSKVVLGYLYNSSKKFQLYVTNRVHNILAVSNRQEWHYVETKENPADLASRGCSAADIVKNQKWWKGPTFLQTDHSYEKNEHYVVSQADPEVKKEVLNLSIAVKPWSLVEAFSRQSSWYKIKKSIAYWKRYIHILYSRIKKEKPLISYSKQRLSVVEMYKAQYLLILLIQRDVYSDLIKSLSTHRYPRDLEESKHRRSHIKEHSNLYKLDVYLDKEDNLLRVGGRLKRASIPRDIMHPVLIPKDHVLTPLLVQHYHKLCYHSGRGITLNTLRQQGLWVTHGRSLVYTLIKDCVVCQELRGRPRGQKMSDLPQERTEEVPPFTYVGCDVFGPFYVKQGRALRKRWVCAFTCFTIRAVHVEKLDTMDTSSFINAYRRFLNRRGPCRAMYCDCGSNFIGAKGELESALAEWNVDKIKEDLLKQNCDFFEFRFNFPKSSHKGGVWERMIRSMRNALSYLLALHSESLDDELLVTFLTEAEAVVNSRPLTYVDMTSPEEPPITPTQLLTLKNTMVLPPPGEFMREDLYCRKRWRKVQYLANQFWYKWRGEYLHQLQQRQKWIKESENLQVDDIVLLVDDSAPRNRWPKGRVTQVYPGKDGLVRKITVKTADSEYDRPIQKAIFLFRP